MGRRTIGNTVTVSGVGLHTGADVRVTLKTATSGQGVVFRRVDLPGTPEVPARLTQVGATERRTTLGEAEQRIDTVEHLLAAVASFELDDLVIEIDGPEVPILDGSFAPFVEALADAGIVEQAGDPVVYRVCHAFDIVEGDAAYVVSPSSALRVTASIEWDHALIGRQAGSFDITRESFQKELAGARTFGFLREVEALQARGLALGGSATSAVILSDDAVVGTDLRWPDEFVRHKAGDIVGDLALLGGRVAAHVVATRPSHQGNIALARSLQRRAQRSGPIAMDVNRILEVIPHRFPFLLVDRIVEVEGDRRIVGLKNVTINEPFFQGHFPGHPIMPGVLIVEAMAQVGGMLLLDKIENPQSKLVYFMSIDGVKFRRPVVPGDQLRCEVELIQNRGRTCRMTGMAYVDGQLVAEALMMARVVDR